MLESPAFIAILGILFLAALGTLIFSMGVFIVYGIITGFLNIGAWLARRFLR